MLPLGEELRFRGVAPSESPGGTTPRGEASGSSVGPEPISAELQHEGHKRAAPENSFPQAGHFISLWPEYIIPASELWLRREIPPECGEMEVSFAVYGATNLERRLGA